jgi:Fe-S cluster biogenesis protein NfuA
MAKNKEEFRQDVEKVLDVVRQGLAMHGGDVEIADVEPETGTVFVRFKGACVGCPLSALTFQSGIEETLMEMLPDVQRVVQAEV